MSDDELSLTPKSVSFALARLGFFASRRFTAAIAPLGLEPRQFLLLRNVAAREGRSQQALGEAMGVPPSRMVALIDELQERGLVERRANPSDRRARALYVTEEGQRVIAEGRRRAAANERELCAPLPPAEREQLLALLEKLGAGHGLPDKVHPGMLMGPGPGRFPFS